jgi:hypothetical protein
MENLAQDQIVLKLLMLMEHVEAVKTIITGIRKNKNAYQEFVIIDQELLEMDSVRLVLLSFI